MSTKKILILFLITLLCLTGIFPFATAETVDYVHLGGIPVGITLENPGLYICGKSEVVTKNGVEIPLLNIDVLPGDYLVEINSIKIKTINDLTNVLNETQDEVIKITILRKNELINFEVRPSVDALTKDRKLGIVVQDGLSGVGTLTYVKEDGSFGALGHSINLCGEKLLQDGNIFKCKIIGVKMPRKGEAGELQGVFDKNSKPTGYISKNNDYGIFGKCEVGYKNLPLVRLGRMEEVKEGKAFIYTSVNGNKPEKYEIQIVKAFTQDKKSTKSMVIQVTDGRLIKKTGGIVQGMSGSPIVQDGRLIGAVTHVFTNDATKGYGLFIDWMI